MRVIVRGDCCSRRALALNPDLFDGSVAKVIANQKCPNSAFTESLYGLDPDYEVMRRFFDEDRANDALKRFFAHQIERSTLKETRADLIVMDSYSDMNFQSYRHRQDGWQAWFNPKYINDKTAFEQTFALEGYRSLVDAVEDNVKVIQHFRAMNGDIPVLYLSQPLSYYRQLDHRSEFQALGALLEQRVPNLFWGGNLRLTELDPDDMDSCGPGQTLHFQASTYRRMYDTAMEKGLGEALAASIARPRRAGRWALANTPHTRQSPDTAVDPDDDTDAEEGEIEIPTASTKTPSEVRSSVAPASSVSEAASDILSSRPGKSPVEEITMSLHGGSPSCVAACAKSVENGKKTLLNYARFDPPLQETHRRLTPMVLELGDYPDYAAYEAEVRKSGKGARLRKVRQSIREGYYVKPFAWELHIPDIYDVNTSKEVRSGGEMRSSYTRTIQQMGGEPQTRPDIRPTACVNHWRMNWGVFKAEPGHVQGQVSTDERLVGYIALWRWGDLALYSKILGHGDHLGSGVMIHLHHEVMRWMLGRDDPRLKDLRLLMYGAQQHGSDGLRDWKSREAFQPHDLLITAEDTVSERVAQVA